QAGRDAPPLRGGRSLPAPHDRQLGRRRAGVALQAGARPGGERGDQGDPRPAARDLSVVEAGSGHVATREKTLAAARKPVADLHRSDVYKSVTQLTLIRWI